MAINFSSDDLLYNCVHHETIKVEEASAPEVIEF